MFNKDFYPTPEDVIQSMLIQTNISHNSHILDPSGGKGNILDYIRNNYLTDNLYYSEIEPELQSILNDKKYKQIGSDFLQLTKEDVSHIDFIIMNPPFSKDIEHINHAWNIAPQGCEIVSLLNSETYSYGRGYKNSELTQNVKAYGLYENLGEVFKNSERHTNVNVGLVKLYKPITTDNIDFDMFYFDVEEEYQENGLIQYNEVRALVNRYVGISKKFDGFFDNLKSINDDIKYIKGRELKITTSYSTSNYDLKKEDLLIQLRIDSWEYIFNKMNMEKYLTSSVIEKLRNFSHKQQNVPFTMKNIYVLLDMLFQTRVQNLEQSLVSAIDKFTKYTHENRYGLEGWKTNLGYMLNKKIILHNKVDATFGGRYYLSSYRDELDDLLKVMCFMNNVSYDNVQKPNEWIKDHYDTNTWYDVQYIETSEDGKEIIKQHPIFFRFKFYKKRTLHLEFLDKKQWQKLNLKYGEIKGFTLQEKQFK